MHPQFPARNDQKTAWRVIDKQAVVLSLEDKQIRGLNPMGTFIWELLDGRTSPNQIAKTISEEFEIDFAKAKKDAQNFLDELAKKEMISWESLPKESQPAK